MVRIVKEHAAVFLDADIFPFYTSASCLAVISERESAEWEADSTGDAEGDFASPSGGESHATPKETEQAGGGVVSEAELARYFERITVSGHCFVPPVPLHPEHGSL